MLSKSEYKYLEDINAFEKERGIDNAKTVRSRIRKSFRIAKDEIIFILDHDWSGRKRDQHGMEIGRSKQRIIDLNDLADLIKTLANYTNKYLVADDGTDAVIIEERSKDYELESVNTALEIVRYTQRQCQFIMATMNILLRSSDLTDNDRDMINSFSSINSDLYIYLFKKEKLMEIKRAELVEKWKR